MNETLFSSKRHDWETPQALFDELDREFHFSKIFSIILSSTDDKTAEMIIQKIEEEFK